ncbi:MAG TPA: hypothetical protein VKH41_03055 [Myxococcota bacterium]|nr:hypothetical protein [Myxococcota bacterium]
MPQKTSAGIDVSREEERYLRSAFRRFALPYVLVFAAVAWAATTFVSGDGPAGSSQETKALRDKVASLEQSVAGLEARLDEVGTELERATGRMGALEGRKPERAPAVDTDGLERALGDATRRIAELERQNGSGATAAERIDALAARMQRIESAARPQTAPPTAPAAPAPAAPAPAPIP